MSNQIEPVLDLEMIQQIDEFIDEQVDSPKGLGFSLKMGRARVAYLIIENDCPRSRQISQGKEIVMREAWPAMQDDERRVGAVADVAKDTEPSVVCFRAHREWDRSLRGGFPV